MKNRNAKPEQYRRPMLPPLLHKLTPSAKLDHATHSQVYSQRLISLYDQNAKKKSLRDRLHPRTRKVHTDNNCLPHTNKFHTENNCHPDSPRDAYRASFKEEIQRNLQLIKRQHQLTPRNSQQKENSHSQQKENSHSQQKENSHSQQKENSQMKKRSNRQEYSSSSYKNCKSEVEQAREQPDIFARINLVMKLKKDRTHTETHEEETIALQLRSNCVARRDSCRREAESCRQMELRRECSREVEWCRQKSPCLKNHHNYHDWHKLSITDKQYEQSSYERETDRLEDYRSRNDGLLRKYFQSRRYLDQLVKYTHS